MHAAYIHFHCVQCFALLTAVRTYVYERFSSQLHVLKMSEMQTNSNFLANNKHFVLYFNMSSFIKVKNVFKQ